MQLNKPVIFYFRQYFSELKVGNTAGLDCPTGPSWCFFSFCAHSVGHFCGLITRGHQRQVWPACFCLLCKTFKLIDALKDAVVSTSLLGLAEMSLLRIFIERGE